MLPNLPQRLLIAVGLVVGGLFLLAAEPALLPGDGMGGITLLETRLGFGPGGLILLLAGLPAIVLALVTSAAGNQLGGVFAASGALTLLAIAGGPIDGWLWRNAALDALPDSYLALTLELMIWTAALAGLLTLIQWSRRYIRPHLPQFLQSRAPSHPSPFRGPNFSDITAAILCAAVGALISSTMLKDTDVGQVTGALLTGFLLAGLLTRIMLSHASPAAVLMGPSLAGAASYLYVVLWYIDPVQVLAHWYRDEFLTLALVLPIQYISMGVAGTVLGLGLGQSLEDLHHDAVYEQQHRAVA